MRATSPKRILVIEDDPQILTFLVNLFRIDGWDVQGTPTGTEGIEKIERERYDVILTDLMLPGADGIEILRTVKKIQSDAEVVLMTGYGTVDSAIEAMRAGAFHFLMKPFRAEEVCHLVDKAYDRRQLTRENLFLRAEARGKYQVQSVVGTSPAIQESLSRVQQLADTETPVLIEGEHGTGRGFFARILHYQSARSGGLFVPVTCGGIPEEMLESELFGYAQGAYQRAMLPRAGKAELASRGTLYLADIEKAGTRSQEKILKLLTTKTVSPVGSDRDIEVDVRLVASSASRIDALAEKGKFLRALWDALQPGLIRFAPLRERTEDIPLLLHHYLFESNRKRKKPLRGVSEAALSALTAYPWPGNVRELADLVKSISSRKRQGSVVDAADLPTEILYGRRREAAMDKSAAAGHPPDIREAIKDLDNQMVKQALALSEGDKAKAAALLNIEVAVLEKLMRDGGDEEETRGGQR
ncbi:MAG TPA: sigma-54 dependent transcriptional regulator [Candidatus Limnocylindrales bacterium]|nr:sigma-54 dependent transcriptional regulator [Candidatus Limnocylindrales bacterium]